MKVLIFTLFTTFENPNGEGSQVVDIYTKVLGGKDDYDRTVSARYPLVIMNPYTGEDEVMFTREELDDVMRQGSRAAWEGAVAKYQALKYVHIEREAWYMPNLGRIYAETISKEIDL